MSSTKSKGDSFFGDDDRIRQSETGTLVADTANEAHLLGFKHGVIRGFLRAIGAFFAFFVILMVVVQVISWLLGGGR